MMASAFWSPCTARIRLSKYAKLTKALDRARVATTDMYQNVIPDVNNSPEPISPARPIVPERTVRLF